MDTTFQGFRVGRDGMPWASAPGTVLHPMMVSQSIQTRRGCQAGAVSPTGFRPAPPGVRLSAEAAV